MPLYEYLCSKCGKTFEVIQKFVDAPLEVHEGCGGHVERLISTSALMFKGSGFYITDYAKGGSSKLSEGKGEKSESKGESKSESKSESSSETKSESKSDSKSETKSDSKASTPAPAKSD